ncbi:hypothetical protein A0H81_02713 [Grifola frondosa]|uniref:F-box domain-containing protein n=1 Tax=Grifola frondosa TaxID=5627 RepID=A0A1C7MP37_GRIFR|nr:hypothetical protein A0H81_02713 [Grifola frondosa]
MKYYKAAIRNRRTLARLARTCTTFTDPALGVLWDTLGDIIPLLKISRSIQLVCINSRSLQYSLCEDVPSDGRDWLRLREYARRSCAVDQVISAWETIYSFPGLTDLTVDFGHYDDIFPDGTGFAALRSLAATGMPSALTQLISSITSDHVQSLVLYQRNVSRYTERMQNLCSKFASSLREVSYTAIWVPTHHTVISSISHIRSFLDAHELECLKTTIYGTTFATDADFHQMARSWPKLRKFVHHLEPRPLSDYSDCSPPSSRTLLSFACNCPSLTELSIHPLHLNSSLTLNGQPVPRLYHGLRCLQLYGPVLWNADPMSLALLLDRLFPYLDSAGLLNEDGLDAEWAKVLTILWEWKEARRSQALSAGQAGSQPAVSMSTSTSSPSGYIPTSHRTSVASLKGFACTPFIIIPMTVARFLAHEDSYQ